MQANTVMSEINEKAILMAIHRLKPELRIPLSMFIEGFHYEETVVKLGVPMGTVKSRIYYARQKLSVSLSDFKRQ